MEKDKSICYTKECRLLNLLACPYIGIYSGHYDLLVPNLVFQSKITSNILRNFPAQVKEIYEQNKRYASEFLVINADMADIVQKHFSSGNDYNLKRFNMVPHPLIFSPLTYLNKDYSVIVTNAIYTINSFDLIRETQENVRIF